MATSDSQVSMKYVINKKVTSKKYLESLLNDPEPNSVDDITDSSDTSRDLSESAAFSNGNTSFNSVGNQDTSYSSNGDGQNNHDNSCSKGSHNRQDSNGSLSSFKKTEGVSNSIKALQDKIKKGLDLNESENTRSPPLSVKSFRSNYEKNNSHNYKSPSLKSPEIPEAMQIKLKSVSNHNKENTLDSSLLSFDSDTEKAPGNPFGGIPRSNSSKFDKVNNKTPVSVNTTANIVDNKPLNNAAITVNTRPRAPSTDSTTSKAPTLTQSPIINNKKKSHVPQFKVIKKTSTPLNSPTSPTSSIFSNDSSRSAAHQELRQLQIIDKEITKKIKKIKSEIKYIEDSLPPNPCVHDFQSRKKLAAAKQTLEKSLEFWEKKKYENGISFSKMTRKVVYSGGEEVTTFFSGRVE
ncbi:hypothetical protein DASC09_016360 [Saccharomycopsis crataegensis]|uniref:Uncharacterized protein n=1 Tax=Saccharomycopsis crataegensis TaxID=43959 RepID=A0AAV5QI00_9ASCO|nr:hypothetical protein DASC09_016360 [Saccharomycopsis crataegensis]